MKVRKKCLKCGHVAVLDLYELASCDRCGALYAKVEQALAAGPPKEPAQLAAARGRRGALLQVAIAAVAVAALAGYAVRRWSEGEDIRAAVAEVLRHGDTIGDTAAAQARRRALGPARIQAERLKYKVRIVEANPAANEATIEVANGSAVTLPYLTVEMRSYVGGELVRRSREPTLVTGGLGPGQRRQLRYVPAGGTRATEMSIALAAVPEDGDVAAFQELGGPAGPSSLVANCPAVDLAVAEAALHRIGTLGPSGADLQLQEPAEAAARERGEALARAVAAIVSCRNGVMTSATVRTHNGGHLAFFGTGR